MDEAVKQFQDVKGQVSSILKISEKARNSDMYLIYLWLHNFGKINLMSDLQVLCHSDRNIFETIRRSRQQIQAAGEYLPTDETVIKRRRLQDVYKKMMSGGAA